MTQNECILVPCDDPLLSTELEPFDFSNPPIDPIELTKVMFDMMSKHNGLGLSANQLGLPYRAFIMRGNPSIVCFNPKIVDASSVHSVMEEGCLTYPLLFVKIRRPSAIKVRYTNELGEVKTEKFTGITARCFQHELDHLNGINYLERANKYHLDKAKRDLKLFKRKQKRVGAI
jgi:peptide deformylase